MLWALIPIVFFSFSKSKLPGYILPSIPPIAILTGDYLFRRRQPGLNRWVLLGHAVLCGVMTMSALLLPWFVAHGAQMPPARPLVAALLAACGAALLILIVVNGFGVARLRLVTTAVLVVLVFFLYGVGPFFGSPEVSATKRVIHLLDRCLLRAPAGRSAGHCGSCRRDRRGLPRPPRHGVWALVLSQSRGGELRGQRRARASSTCWWCASPAAAALTCTPRPRSMSTSRAGHYEQLFTWPEQGLVVYLVGSR